MNANVRELKTEERALVVQALNELARNFARNPSHENHRRSDEAAALAATFCDAKAIVKPA